MQIQPYLFFNGRCDEAIEFYRVAVGAEVTLLMRFKDSPEPTSHGMEEKVMHANLRIGDTTVLVSDEPKQPAGGQLDDMRLVEVGVRGSLRHGHGP